MEEGPGLMAMSSHAVGHRLSRAARRKCSANVRTFVSFSCFIILCFCESFIMLSIRVLMYMIYTQMTVLTVF